MANPIETVTKPLAFGARQAVNITQYAVRTGTALIESVRGGETEPPGAEEQGPRSSSRPKPLDDIAITRKVETHIFRDSKVPKGKIQVNTVDGVVWLRGEAKNPTMVKKLEREASSVPEVKRVENLLHLPKTPAPSRTDTPPSERKTRRTRTPAAARRVTPRRVNADKFAEDAKAEPSPKELAAERKGRPPAPLGSQDQGGERSGGNGSSAG